MTRRDLLATGVGLTNPLRSWSRSATPKPKRVIVVGAGLAGLTCAYELSRRNHDVVVLEASEHTGGHVHTLKQGLPDGLYADVGAEHFTKPGYELCWRYFEEFQLPVLAYPHRENMLRVVEGRMVSEQDARMLERAKLNRAGFSAREMQQLRQDGFRDLLHFYFEPFIERIKDEYKPLGVGLDHLDQLSVTDLLRQQGASAAAISRFGSNDSALHTIWKMAIFCLRKTTDEPHALFRIRGGNQSLPDALAQRLGSRIQKGHPVAAIRHSRQSVQVTVKTAAGSTSFVEGDYLACCTNAVVLRRLQVSPAWPESKRYAIENVPYTVEARPVVISTTKFWKTDGHSGNMDFASPLLGPMWPMAQELPTPRGLLIGTSQAGLTSEMALRIFHRYYPGKPTIESARVVDWSRDRWSMTCEARTYRPGDLTRMWPAVIAPVGRIHFAGAYCDNQSWGMEAATRSGMRVARAIHEA